MAGHDWQRIAAQYEDVRASPVSLDTLIEWPAQQRMVGSVEGLSLLDLGCGSGAKSIWFAQAGARRVVGVDIVDAFLPVPAGKDVVFRVGDLSDIGSTVGEERFDIVTIFQAIGYARDERELMRELARLVLPGGKVVISRSHPIRWAVERSHAEHVPLGAAYRNSSPFTYPATWGTGTVTHNTFTFSDVVMPAIEAGFTLERVEEPSPTDELRTLSPSRAAWMDEHVGMIVCRFRK